MKNNIVKKLSIIHSICLLSACLLSGCGQPENPLLSESNIKNLKGEIMVHLAFVSGYVSKCSPYLAEPTSHHDVKAECDKWVVELYDMLLQKGELPYKTTLAEFTDPAFWKILTQHKG